VSQPVLPTPVDDDAEAAPGDAAGAGRIDVEQIARLVYQMMLEDLAIGRERGA
jgi:hypothetical protein